MRALLPSLAFALVACGLDALGSATAPGSDGAATEVPYDAGGADVADVADAASDAGPDSGGASVLGTLQLPANAGAKEGNSSNSSPFGGDAQRFQSVYGEALLTALPRGAIIKAIGFRLEGGATSFTQQTIANLEIRLSTSAKPPGSLSLTFAANRGADSVVVRAGPLTIAPADYPSGPGPNAFGKRIDFDMASFTYKGGPLLLEIATTAVPAGRPVDNVFPSSQDSQSVYGTGFSATMADGAPFFDLVVVEYTFEYPR